MLRSHLVISCYNERLCASHISAWAYLMFDVTSRNAAGTESTRQSNLVATITFAHN